MEELEHFSWNNHVFAQVFTCKVDHEFLIRSHPCTNLLNIWQQNMLHIMAYMIFCENCDQPQEGHGIALICHTGIRNKHIILYAFESLDMLCSIAPMEWMSYCAWV